MLIVYINGSFAAHTFLALLVYVFLTFVGSRQAMKLLLDEFAPILIMERDISQNAITQSLLTSILLPDQDNKLKFIFRKVRRRRFYPFTAAAELLMFLQWPCDNLRVIESQKWVRRIGIDWFCCHISEKLEVQVLSETIRATSLRVRH